MALEPAGTIRFHLIAPLSHIGIYAGRKPPTLFSDEAVSPSFRRRVLETHSVDAHLVFRGHLPRRFRTRIRDTAFGEI